MISDIRNTFWRRVALVWTVAAVVVCLGPAWLIRRTVCDVRDWIEDEFEADLAATWRGDQHKRTK